MPDRLNDTDPQSPRALTHRTDPGLGSAPAVLGPRSTPAPTPRPSQAAKPETSPVAPPAAPTPTPGSASIDALLDGITGPRPPAPPARREVAPDSIRAYSAARQAPAPQPMPPDEPLVVSPDPPLYSGAGRVPRDIEETVPRKPDPASTRPVARKPAEERTVYTGRRALARNLAVVLVSSALVAVMMMTIMRWKEAGRPRRASAVVVMPSEVDNTEATPAAAAVAPPPAQAVVPAPAVVVATSAPSVVASAAASSAALPSAKPASAAVKRSVRASAPPPAALDDLNREIRH